MVSRTQYSTRDPEQALPVLGEYFPAFKMSNPRDGFSFEISTAETNPIQLVHYRVLSANSSSSADMSGTLAIGQLDSGKLDLATGRRAIDTSQPWLFPQRPLQAEWDDITITAMSVSVPRILRFARAQLGDDVFRLKFTSGTPADPARARQWSAFVTYLRSAMEEGGAMESEIVQANAFAHVASMLLVTFPNTYLEAAGARGATMAQPSAVRRAVQFVDDNARSPITVEDIARAARLSVRGLQYAFQTSLDTTPSAYLRRARLEGVHKELLAADAGGFVTVLGIATAWGFTNAGRFAQQYRAAYGVTPRSTLES